MHLFNDSEHLLNLGLVPWRTLLTRSLSHIYCLFLGPPIDQPHGEFRQCHLEDRGQGERFEWTNLHDAARCVSSCRAPVGGVIAASPADPRAAVVPGPAAAVNSVGSVALSAG